MTHAELILWRAVRKRALAGARFRRQHPIGSYVADFACLSARLVVEVDGATHWTEEDIIRDARRAAALNAQGWRVVRVGNTDIYENPDGVWRFIEAALLDASHAPPQAGELSSHSDD